MTRKHYILIAGAIKEQLDVLNGIDSSADAIGDLRSTALRIAAALRRDNPRFNQDRFIKACGFPD